MLHITDGEPLPKSVVATAVCHEDRKYAKTLYGIKSIAHRVPYTHRIASLPTNEGAR